MDADNFVTVRTYHDSIMGQLVLSALVNAGIRLFESESVNTLPFENEYVIRVYKDDVDEALAIIEESEEAEI